MKPPGHETTKSLAIGLTVLQHLIDTGHSLGVSQIASHLGLAKGSAHRILQTLCDSGFVEQNEENRQYNISPQIFRFLHQLTSQFGPNSKVFDNIRTFAAKHRCSVYLSMLAGRNSFVISASGPYGDTTTLGSEAPAYASSCGKILVAQLPPSEWGKFAPRPEEKPLGRCTNLDTTRFYAELKLAREEGVAWNQRESTLDYCSVAARLNEAKSIQRLAVAILLPYKDWVAQDREDLKKLTLQLAEELSVILHPQAPYFGSR